MSPGAASPGDAGEGVECDEVAGRADAERRLGQSLERCPSRNPAAWALNIAA